MAKEKLLTDLKCKTAKAGAKVRYLADGNGLRLRVRPDGSKAWLLRYTLNGRESAAGLGLYPAIGLEAARQAAQEARRLVAAGIAPPRHRRERRAAAIAAGEATFQAIAEEWLTRNRADWSEHHHERNAGLLRRILFPVLGPRPISEITEAELLAPLRRAHDDGIRESARRARAVAAQVFDYAKDTHRATHNPARELVRSSVLKRAKGEKVKHFTALKPEQVGPMLVALENSGVEPVTRAALKLMLATGVRDAALRAARWSEFDLEAHTWTVPKERMKSGNEFKTPLPRQCVTMLRELAKLTKPKRGDGFVFRSYGASGHVAENTLRITLHRLGFAVTAHGLRSLLCDVLIEAGFAPDVVERQLDHVERNSVRAAYFRSDLLMARSQAVQWYADWTIAMKDGKPSPKLPVMQVKEPTNVVAMPKKKRVA